MNSLFSDPAVWNRIQFAFTITYHYLFSAIDNGSGVVPGLLEMACPADG
jgi:cytochrome bd-type quinol oxidase subunit 1